MNNPPDPLLSRLDTLIDALTRLETNKPGDSHEHLTLPANTDNIDSKTYHLPWNTGRIYDDRIALKGAQGHSVVWSRKPFEIKSGLGGINWDSQWKGWRLPVRQDYYWLARSIIAIQTTPADAESLDAVNLWLQTANPVPTGMCIATGEVLYIHKLRRGKKGMNDVAEVIIQTPSPSLSYNLLQKTNIPCTIREADWEDDIRTADMAPPSIPSYEYEFFGKVFGFLPSATQIAEEGNYYRLCLTSSKNGMHFTLQDRGDSNKRYVHLIRDHRL